MKIFIAAISIFLCLQISELHAIFRRIKKLSGEDGHYDLLDAYMYDNDLLIHVMCSKENPVRCKIEKSPIFGENITHSCEFELTENLKNNYSLLNYQMFGEDKFIITEPVTDAVMFYTVHLTECRLSNGYRLPDTLLYLRHNGEIENQLLMTKKIVPYENAYDVFYEVLSSHRPYRVRIDSEGKLIEGPVKFDNGLSVGPVHLIAANQSAERRLVYGKVTVLDKHGHVITKIALVVTLPDGTKKQAVQIDSRILKIWTDNYLIGAWFWHQASNYTLVQTDSLGNVKLRVNIVEPKNTSVSALYNLAEGGFLLFKKIETDNFESIIGIHIAKVDAAGQTIGKIDLKLSDFMGELKQVYASVLWENKEENEYCAAFIGIIFEDGEYSEKLFVKCFSDTDFL